MYRSNENGGVCVFKIRYICIYKCLIFLRVQVFSIGLTVLVWGCGVCFVVLGFCVCFTISFKKILYIGRSVRLSLETFLVFQKPKPQGEIAL